MKRHLSSWLAGAVIGAAAWITPAAAQDPTAGLPGEWLAHYTSARTLGLGSAYVASADDPLGVLWNPAGISFMDQNEVRFENARLFEQTSINSFGFAVPGSRWPSFGVSMVSLGTGDLERTSALNEPLGTFRESETAWLLTGSKAFTPRFAVGTNVKLVQQTVESFSAAGFGVDLGAIAEITPQLKVGISAANLGGPSLTLKDVEETYPTQFRGGLALGLLGGRGLIALDVDRTEGLGTRVHAGTEYWIQSGLALRAGWSDDGGSGGFTYHFAPAYALDYAAVDHPLGLQHRVGLSWRFGGFFASSTAEPQVFSPTGERAVTRISLNARTKAEPASWTLDILNKSDEVARRFGGPGQPPAHLEWDGKDENGLRLPDGVYRYSLAVKDAVGRSVVGPMHSIEISTAGPQGAVPLIPTAADDPR